MQAATRDGPRSIVVVEDEVELGRMIRDHLTAQGYQVTLTANGAEALRAVMAADYDAVVCDMVMPRMAGDMFYYAVQRVKPRLCERFIFITGYGESPQVKDFLTRVSEMVLMKPFHLDDLSATLRLLFKELEDPSRRLDLPPGTTPIRPSDGPARAR